MQSYIQEHTIGGIIGTAFRIYTQNFMVIFFAYLIPLLPFYLLQIFSMHLEPGGLSVEILLIVSLMLGIPTGLVAITVVTLVISDICIGIKVSIAWIYRQVFNVVLFKLFVTILLEMLVITVGFLLFVIPGYILMVWFLLSNTIVILEDTWGIKALKRSMNLGSTKHWRNLGVLLTVMFVIIAPIMALMISVNNISPDAMFGTGFQIIFNLITQLVAPIPLIATVLLYYDLRVRKESYNVEALA